MTTFPTLYKKTSTGAIQYWTISVDTSACTITTEYGQLGTNSPQTTVDQIREGKNLGKKNETTAAQQAELEAKSKWEKQKKKGYVETQEAAQSGATDELIEGGVSPMLAHKFAEQAHKIKYPAYAQPKLDGIRCVAILESGKCTLWSRTRKRITGVPHIERAIEKAFGEQSIILDGELYNHDFKKDFEKIVSFVRQETPAQGHEVVQYHVYDVVAEAPFKARKTFLELQLEASGALTEGSPIQLVETVAVASEDELMERFEAFLAQGYEGAMVRNADGAYVNKRSYDLQKLKEFEDAEFEIVGVKEGRGKLQGHAATFVCRMSDGQLFEAKMKGDTAKLKEYFENHLLWEGKRLTVKYQGLTNKNGVPRFPVGITIRWDTDDQ